MRILHEPAVHGYPGKLDITRTCGSWLSRKAGYYTNLRFMAIQENWILHEPAVHGYPEKLDITWFILYTQSRDITIW